MLIGEELFDKSGIGEKVFKKFLRISNHIDPKPVENLERKDCHFVLEYTFISIFKEASVHDWDGKRNTVEPKEQVEYWVKVYYRAKNGEYVWHYSPTINLYIESQDKWPRSISKPKKREFYLRLKPSDYAIIEYTVKKHREFCIRENAKPK